MNSIDYDLEEIVEIRDPGIDREAVFQEILDNLIRRRRLAREQGLDYEALARGQPASPHHGPFSYDLHYSLKQMQASYNRIEVGLSLTESRIPVIAPLVQRVRLALHRLVLYYTNRMAGRQSRFNEYTLKAMTDLIKEIRDENEELRREISGLEERLEDLESESA